MFHLLTQISNTSMKSTLHIHRNIDNNILTEIVDIFW